MFLGCEKAGSGLVGRSAVVHNPGSLTSQGATPAPTAAHGRSRSHQVSLQVKILAVRSPRAEIVERVPSTADPRGVAGMGR